jgi:low affinity Fe/Cu permease
LEAARAEQFFGFKNVNELFRKFAAKFSTIAGSPWAFITALIVLILWAISGPMFGFSDTWQLVINTGTTIVTFLMVFLIQNTQNRDAKAIHLKLDELIRSVKDARNSLVDLEDLSDEELDQLQQQFKRLREKQVEFLGKQEEAIEEIEESEEQR